jgi:hypothetical protein
MNWVIVITVILLVAYGRWYWRSSATSSIVDPNGRLRGELSRRAEE